MALIAIIEDNVRSSELFERLLHEAGHLAVCAAGGEQTPEWLREMQPDLLVLDVNLPGISGMELLRRLRADPALQTLPVVMLSGVADFSVQAQAFSLGALDYIVKGLDWRSMLQRIEQHLPKEPQGI
jgi:DNA-binding response OmpR family regulator